MKGASFFIVEDHKAVAQFLKELIEDMNYQVVGVDSGQDENLINRIGQASPDMVMMDITIPGEKDGIELAEDLNKKYEIPVIYATSRTDELTMQRAKVTMPYGYLIKPFELVDVKTTIEVALARLENDRIRKALYRDMHYLHHNGLDVSMVIKEDGTVETVTSNIQPLLGYKPEELKNENISAYLTDSRQDKLFREAMENGVTLTGLSVIEFKSKSGKGIPFEVAIERAVAKNGQCKLVLQIRDIRRRNLLEASLSQKNKSLRRKLREKERFYSKVINELFTPVQSLLGLSEELSQQFSGDETKFQQCKASLNQLSMIVDDLFELTRQDEREEAYHNERFNPARLLADVVGYHQETLDTRFKQLSFEVEDGVPKLVKSDPMRYRRIISEMLKLAIHHTEYGIIHTDVTIEGSETNYLDLKFRIYFSGEAKVGGKSNKGSGDDPFEKALYDTSDLELGFIYARKILRRLGGHLGVIQETEEGQYIEFSLPAVKPDADITAGSETDQKQRKSAKQVLLIEDNPVNLKLIKKQVEKLGYHVHASQYGYDALNLLSANNYDALLLDVELPDINGIDLVKEIRESEDVSRQIPILLITTHNHYEMGEMVKELGIYAIVGKPFRKEKLRYYLDNLDQTGSSERDTDDIFPDETDMDTKEILEMDLGFIDEMINTSRPMAESYLRHANEHIDSFQKLLNSNEMERNVDTILDKLMEIKTLIEPAGNIMLNRFIGHLARELARNGNEGLDAELRGEAEYLLGLVKEKYNSKLTAIRSWSR